MYELIGCSSRFGRTESLGLTATVATTSSVPRPAFCGIGDSITEAVGTRSARSAGKERHSLATWPMAAGAGMGVVCVRKISVDLLLFAARVWKC